MNAKLGPIVLIYLLIGMLFFPAVTAEPLPGFTEKTAETIISFEELTEFSCSTNELSDAEKEAFFQEILKEGLTVQEISSGVEGDKDRESLDQSRIIDPTGEGREAVTFEVPNQEIDPKEVQFLAGKYYSGEFAFGLLLPDSLRTGRCNDLDKPCPVAGGSLFLRNSGQGIVGDVKNVYNDIKSWFDGNTSTTLSSEQKALLQTQSEFSDQNKFDVQAYKRVKGDMIENSILTESFEATMATNDTRTLSRISTYSMFDKYYNSWYTTGMVVSNFGPAISGALKKAMGWSARRSPFFEATRWRSADAFRRKYMQPNQLLGKWRLQKMQTRIKKYGLDEVMNPLIENIGGSSGYYLVKGTEFRQWFAEATKPGGLLASITDPVKKREIYNLFSDLRGYMRTTYSVLDNAEGLYKGKLLEVANKYGDNYMSSPLGKSLYDRATIEYAQDTIPTMVGVDRAFDLDYPEWITRMEWTGIQDVGLRHAGTQVVSPIYEDSFHIQVLMEEFGQKGDFSSDVLQRLYDLTPDGQGLKLFRYKQTGASMGLMNVDDLEKGIKVGELQNVFVKMGDGRIVKATEPTIPLIKEFSPAGQVERLAAGWAHDETLSAAQFAERLTFPRGLERLKTSGRTNSEWLFNYVAENNWKQRRYTSLLDRAMSHEQELLKAYFSFKGGAKWTVLPYSYWMAKRGFGMEELSAYMLPDNWSSVTHYTEDHEIYDDAFIDFFANEGSDDGDIFVRIIDKLPWKAILNEVSKKFNPVDDHYTNLTRGMVRDKVGNIALYTSGSGDCVGCGVTIEQSGPYFRVLFGAKDEMRNYILEDTPESEKEKGQLLISFAHHMSFSGVGAGDKKSKGDPIDLVEAIKGKNPELKTCGEALEEAFFGWDQASKFGSAAGGVLGFAEDIGYVGFLWAGVVGSIAIQTLMAPKLQDCVDVEEGYYTHFFIPPREEKEAEATALSTEKVSGMIRAGANQFEEMVKGEGGITEEAVGKVKDGIDGLVGNAEDDSVVEAILKTKGLSSGSISATRVFYYWVQGNSVASPSEYKTEGKEILTDPDNNASIEVNYGEGVVSVNGQPIITSPDHTRMKTDNLKIPAEEFPVRLTNFKLSMNPETLLLEMDEDSELWVKDSELKDCIEQAVLQQHGLPLDSDNLSDAFGKVNAVITHNYGNIFAQDGKIIAEGSGFPRKIASDGPSVQIFADMNAFLLNSIDEDPGLGLMKSIQMENGVILYKPSTNELVFWLRHHEKGILEQNDIDGLKVLHETGINPITGCPEDLFSMKVLGDSGSPQKLLRTEQFNVALGMSGSFKVIDTEKYTFVFYEGPPPECTPHLKVINKETGEVYDSVIEAITPTNDGFEVVTDDGQTHDFSFSADQGTPMLNYNGIDTLIKSLTGRNGSFWYDPETGQWYAENGLLLPLLEAFKQKGIKTTVGEDGTVRGVPGSNQIVNIDTGKSDAPWFLPSVPETLSLMFAFVLIALLSFAVIQSMDRKKKLKPLLR